MKKTHNRIGGNLPSTNEILRLQRANKDLMQLSNTLNSYTCEPCTQTHYEQVQSLRSRMEQLKSSNNEVLSSVKQRKKTFEDVAKVVKKQLRDFNELQKGVFDYTRMVKSYH
ncbi:hypothetical protein FGM00_07565 [Aggregatimonas sangjinii]|uniref:Uncharacterized protein n=1 Tax=Aggregatimonas sangjinii TaxID=2583587 RepID=A0A5B7STE4_9FLAO|nr:hypothetical protein [Aggregatimonas sangjinii]QCW99963.1 hypothetical protein FGM00_07565 [Aggregatimonas sangjinii]